MGSKLIKYEVEDLIATITINRPEARNALNDQVRVELYQSLEDANKDPEVHGIIITGGENYFSAGADIQVMSEKTAVEMLYREGLHKVVHYIESIPKPVMAVISGFALGGGCELALACDVRIATNTAVFGQPEVRVGIFPGGGGTQRLSRLVGYSHAKDIIFSGRTVDAEEAYRIGLVSEVVPVNKMTEASRERMKTYIRNGAVTIAAAKIAINTGANIDTRSGDILEKFAFSLMFSTEDQKEGMRAFLEKRKAEFKGR